jgi:exopolysaccharide biosynthesis polyprenyl glycosylphosphotransferase
MPAPLVPKPTRDHSRRRPVVRPLGQPVANQGGNAVLRWSGAGIVGLTVMVVLGSLLDGDTTAADMLCLLALVAVAGAAGHVTRMMPGWLARSLFMLLVAAVAVGVAIGLDALAWIDIQPVAVAGGFGAVLLTVAIAALGGLVSSRGAPPVRIAVIGSPRAAEGLRRELMLGEVDAYEVVGWVEAPGSTAVTSNDLGDPPLGQLDELAQTVRDKRVDLLVMSSDASRLAVFDEVARSCLALPVRFCELAGFHEHLFGHVPVTEINTAWFQYIMHPRYSSATPVATRVLDVVLAIIIGLLVAPVVAVVAMLIRRDGGSVLFKQTRIGEGGKPFQLYKLRTMRSTSIGAQWAAEDDPRITGIGRFLRRSHLDEVPQLINVLRGDMSLVGPRPEQAEFVERLEQSVPFYQRRHLIKPGLTGWAQVRCGYAGSDRGSLWKLSHDLYYLKHRSFTLDVAVLWATVGEIFQPQPHGLDSETVGWVFDDLADPGAVVDNGAREEAFGAVLTPVTDGSPAT